MKYNGTDKRECDRHINGVDIAMVGSTFCPCWLPQSQRRLAGKASEYREKLYVGDESEFRFALRTCVVFARQLDSFFKTSGECLLIVPAKRHALMLFWRRDPSTFVQECRVSD